MKILSVSEHCCGRVWKQGFALEKLGHEVIYMYQRVANQFMEPFFKNTTKYMDVNSFINKLQQYKDIDIIHVHNEPDWMGHMAKQYRPDVPVVFDAHDLFSVRIPDSADKFGDEIKSFKVCDAFVYPSFGYQKHARKLYDKFGIKNKPDLVLYSWPLADFQTVTPLPPFRGIVYEGGLRVKEDHPGIPDNLKYHQYRDFNAIFQKLTEMGIPVMAFPGNEDAPFTHGNSGALVTPPLPYMTLMDHLGRFDWGIVGSPLVDNLQWHYAIPHKFLEYLAAGLPVISFNADEIKKFIDKHQVGITVTDFEEIRDRYQEHNKYRQNVWFLQKLFTMERHIGDLIDLYKELI
jgi:glycosyltransferase involved in cell wall biosynthesis